MSKTFTLLFSMISFLASAGYGYQNRLTITSNNNYSISVVIDGRAYQIDRSGKDREILLSDLRPGTRNLKIYAVKNSGRVGRANINNERNMQLIYNGNLYIRDGVDMDVSINRFGKVFVDEQAMDRYNQKDNRYSNGDRDRYGNGDRNRNAQPMNERSFLQLKLALSRESSEENRVNLVRSALYNNTYVSSVQVRDLLGLLGFEANKLLVAKYCYQFTTDKQNYYTVADGLHYSNSKNELVRFIQQQK